MKYRILATILATLMLVSTLLACGKSPDTGDAVTTTAPAADVGTTTASETTAETAAPTVEDLLGFPEENNNGNVFNILCGQHKAYEFGSESQVGEVVSDAVYQRDLAVEEYLGIDINVILEAGAWAERNSFNDKIVKAVNAGDNSYDLVNNTIVCTMPASQQGIFTEGGELPHVNFDQPWWIANMYERFAIADKLYGFLGDASLSLYKDMNVIFFNKQIWGEKKPDVNLYDLVRKGEWTLDKFIELTSDMAEDLNGDSVYNENDLLTFVGERVPCGTWQTSLGLDVVVLDEAGKPTVLGMTERFVNAYDKMSAYHQNTPGVMRFASIDAQTYDSMKLFANGQVATMCNFIYSTEYIRDMDADYGIIPIPKYDTEQENYITQLGTSTSMLFVPTTASDFALTSKVMESLAYYGYTDVTPKYYEVALKTKYSSDVDMQEMLDLIRETATIDFLFVYGTTLSSAPNEYFRFTSFIPGIASVYSKTQRVFEKSVEKLVAAYEKLP